MQLIHTARFASRVVVALCLSMPAIGYLGVAQAAPAATTPAPVTAPVRFKGTVTAMSGAQLTVIGEDKTSSKIAIAPDAWIVKGRPIAASEIRSGDFVATANVNNPDGTGTSVELRVFPAGMRLGEGSYPMDDPNTTMTNATVAQVTSVGDDRMLTVSFAASAENGTPAGTRTIKLPANVQVVQWYRVALKDLRVDNRLRGRGTPNNGTITADFIFAEDPPPATP